MRRYKAPVAAVSAGGVSVAGRLAFQMQIGQMIFARPLRIRGKALESPPDEPTFRYAPLSRFTQLSRRKSLCHDLSLAVAM